MRILNLTLVLALAIAVALDRFALARKSRLLEQLIVPVVTAVFLAQLLLIWSHNTRMPNALGGWLPWSDAKGYWEGLTHMRLTGQINEWNSRRPLNLIYFLGMDRLSLGHYSGLLLAMTLAVGLCTGYLSLALKRLWGWSAATMSFLYVFFFWQAEAAGVLLSESIGLIFGLAAAFFLLTAFKRRHWHLALLGFFALSWALACRNGAMFALPAVAFGLMRTSTFSGRSRVRRAVELAVAAALPFALSYGLLQWRSETPDGISGNFSYTLYGIVAGRHDWTRAYQDFPEIKAMPETARAQFVYQKAFLLIRENPLRLGLSLDQIPKFSVFGHHYFSFFPFSNLQWLFGVVAAGVMLIWLLRALGARFRWLSLIEEFPESIGLVAACHLGVALSAPRRDPRPRLHPGGDLTRR